MYSEFKTIYFDADRDLSLEETYAIAKRISESLYYGYEPEVIYESFMNWSGLDAIQDYYFEDIVKWSSMEGDMIELSGLIKDITFIITVTGEDREDIVRYYFRNGKRFVSEGRLVFDEVPISFYEGE